MSLSAFSPHPPQAVPLPLEGKDITRLKLRRVCPVGRDTSTIAASEALPDREWVFPFTSAGGAKPIAGRGGLEGFTPPHHTRRGQRLPTDSMPSPAPRVSAGHNFAVILLSKAMDIGRDHLIHRKRSPFPYEGKDLTRPKLRRDCPAGRNSSLLTPHS